jgi:hypothetical protein
LSNGQRYKIFEKISEFSDQPADQLQYRGRKEIRMDRLERTIEWLNARYDSWFWSIVYWLFFGTVMPFYWIFCPDKTGDDDSPLRDRIAGALLAFWMVFG